VFWCYSLRNVVLLSIVLGIDRVLHPTSHTSPLTQHLKIIISHTSHITIPHSLLTPQITSLSTSHIKHRNLDLSLHFLAPFISRLTPHLHWIAASGGASNAAFACPQPRTGSTLPSSSPSLILLLLLLVLLLLLLVLLLLLWLWLSLLLNLLPQPWPEA
jgi:hypothetical protein